MLFTLTPGPDGHTITLHGRLTQQDHDAIRALLRALTLAPGRQHRVDLSGVTFIDSAGFGLLLILDRDVRDKGGGLVFAGARGQVLRLFDTVQARSLLRLAPAEPEGGP